MKLRDDLTPGQRAALAFEAERLARKNAETPVQEVATPEVKREAVAHQPVTARQMTLVAFRHLEIGGHVFAHGAEIIPGLLTKEAADKLIDADQLREYDSRDRRSLYRIFSPFSGCAERELLDKAELTELCFPQ